jgi:alginate O-acetyltransferase complex protein AlgI
MLTWSLVNITWVFFRATNFGKAWEVLSGMFGANAGAKLLLDTFDLVSVTAIIGAILFAHWRLRNRTLESLVERTRPMLLATVWGLMAFAIIISQGTGNAFIYFQF